ncbi:MAG: phytanoyl-CoA dioxygenase family protein [Gammaproteobacteria bacterium]|nr:phytanoyl-CoA dioxygenase family protein [Gammaproteobacteria bacterium]
MGRNDFEGTQSERVYALLAKSDVFERVIANEKVLPIVDELLTPNYLLSAALAIKLHPGESVQPFHCDNSNLPATDRTAIQGISTIWAIDDFTATNGCDRGDSGKSPLD